MEDADARRERLKKVDELSTPQNGIAPFAHMLAPWLHGRADRSRRLAQVPQL
jgi:hypothetical protein